MIQKIANDRFIIIPMWHEQRSGNGLDKYIDVS